MTERVDERRNGFLGCRADIAQSKGSRSSDALVVIAERGYQCRDGCLSCRTDAAQCLHRGIADPVVANPGIQESPYPTRRTVHGLRRYPSFAETLSLQRLNEHHYGIAVAEGEVWELNNV